LFDTLEEHELRVLGSVFLMRYNAPFTPGFMRRNEVGVESYRLPDHEPRFYVDGPWKMQIVSSNRPVAAKAREALGHSAQSEPTGLTQ